MYLILVLYFIKLLISNVFNFFLYNKHISKINYQRFNQEEINKRNCLYNNKCIKDNTCVDINLKEENYEYLNKFNIFNYLIDNNSDNCINTCTSNMCYIYNKDIVKNNVVNEVEYNSEVYPKEFKCLNPLIFSQPFIESSNITQDIKNFDIKCNTKFCYDYNLFQCALSLKTFKDYTLENEKDYFNLILETNFIKLDNNFFLFNNNLYITSKVLSYTIINKVPIFNTNIDTYKLNISKSLETNNILVNTEKFSSYSYNKNILSSSVYYVNNQDDMSLIISTIGDSYEKDSNYILIGNSNGSILYYFKIENTHVSINQNYK